MSYSSGVVVLVNSNHSPDNSLNCTPLCPITITDNFNNNNNNRHDDEKVNCHNLSISLPVITYASCYMMLWLQKWWYYEHQQEWLRWYDMHQMTLKWREKKNYDFFWLQKNPQYMWKTSPKKRCRFHSRSQAWLVSNVRAHFTNPDFDPSSRDVSNCISRQIMLSYREKIYTDCKTSVNKLFCCNLVLYTRGHQPSRSLYL